MKEKLIKYGFQMWQVKDLIKNKKLDTTHGLYILKDNSLYLTNGNTTKKVM